MILSDCLVVDGYFVLNVLMFLLQLKEDEECLIFKVSKQCEKLFFQKTYKLKNWRLIHMVTQDMWWSLLIHTMAAFSDSLQDVLCLLNA